MKPVWWQTGIKNITTTTTYSSHVHPLGQNPSDSVSSEDVSMLWAKHLDGSQWCDNPNFSHKKKASWQFRKVNTEDELEGDPPSTMRYHNCLEPQSLWHTLVQLEHQRAAEKVELKPGKKHKKKHKKNTVNRVSWIREPRLLKLIKESEWTTWLRIPISCHRFPIDPEHIESFSQLIRNQTITVWLPPQIHARTAYMRHAVVGHRKNRLSFTHAAQLLGTPLG